MDVGVNGRKLGVDWWYLLISKAEGGAGLDGKSEVLKTLSSKCLRYSRGEVK